MKQNKKLKALVGVLTASIIFLGAAGSLVYAEQSASPSKPLEEAKTVTNDETVYLLTDANGKEHQRIVNDKGTLCYEGYEKAQVPVMMDIVYTLDGKEISAEKLAGKNGHLVMTLHYTNHKKSGSVYVPFLAVSGMVLDNQVFSNVDVVNGKVVDDGNRKMVIGYALPGMQQSLGTAEIDIPSEITISCDVKNFELETIYTFITSEIFTDLNVDKSSDLTDLTKNLDKLTAGFDTLLKGTGQLDDGALKLSDGADKLLDGTDSLVNGIEELCGGSKALKAGASELGNGADNLAKGADNLAIGAGQLEEGLNRLNEGLSQISAQSGSLNGGAKQMVSSVFAQANKSLAAAGINVELTSENYGQVLDAASAQMPQAAGQLMEVKAQLDEVLRFYQGVLAYTAGVDASAKGAAEISSNTEAITAGAKALSDGARTLSKGQKQMTQGIDSLSEGAEKLSKGAGVLTEKEREFVSGVHELSKGAKALNLGAKEMAAEVKGQLGKLSDTDLANVFDRIEAMKNAAKGYRAFNGNEGTDSVKFIYKTDTIEIKK